MRKRKYTEQQFVDAVKSSYSIAEVLQKLHLAEAGGSYKTFYKTVKDLQLNTSHFTGQGHLKGKTHNWTPARLLETILVVDSIHTNSNNLKKRLIRLNLLENKCYECDIDEWNGKKLSLHMDHINGINTDNRLENLRILCPNCHSQTLTYCRKK